MATTFPGRHVAYAPPALWRPALERALAGLMLLVPEARTLVLEGLLSLIEADNRVNIPELELLGLFCATLELPLPLVKESVSLTDDVSSRRAYRSVDASQLLSNS